MRTIRKAYILSLLFFSFNSIFSQVLSKKELIKAVHEADIFYYYEENYEKAAPLYESLLRIYPGNSNFSAKLGICYLNIDGKKTDALRLLLMAASNIIGDDKEYIEYGEKAPLDTYFYLATAYHQNDSLEKAISLYVNAEKRLGETQIFSREFIDNQIKNCRYAKEMENKPQALKANLFTSWIKDYPGACNPVVSKNDSVFIFTLKKDDKTSILCSYKSGTWKKPVDITKQLGGYDRFYSNSITGDGKLLIIYMQDGGDGNLYYSQRKDTSWTKIKSLGKNINTIYWESHGFITPDGKTIYLASNRPGGEGELDIWVSEKDENNSWKRPVNCGKVINTPFNENTPFFDSSSNTLFFSSLGHLGMGGYDVFQSLNRNGKWTNPLALQYALNNTTENIFFILNNNTSGFITSLYDEKTHSRNIYSIATDEPVDKRIIAQGTLSLQDGMAVDPVKAHIQLFDQKSGLLLKNISISDSGSFRLLMKPGKFKVLISRIGDKTDTINLNVNKETQKESLSLNDTASFSFEIKPGDYQLFVDHIGYKTDTINLNIPTKFIGNFISVNSSLVPEKVASGEFLTLKNILFEFDSYKLTEQARSTLDMIKPILADFPELKVEVSGYTDSKGSSDYNKWLANKRVMEVINYLSSSEISGSRFKMKAYGKSDYESLNTNPDGSDNPEGRKYNRRVAFGIIDPHTGIIIHQETFAPEHLRQTSSVKYSIVLIKSKKNIEDDYFSKLNLGRMHFIKSFKNDLVTSYAIGLFYNKADAYKYLIYAKENGFKDAYIVNQYEINNQPQSTGISEYSISQTSGKNVFTIQLKASREKLNMNQFKGTENVREILADDGYFRYVYGEYNSYSNAKIDLVRLQQSGYKNAFIRNIILLIHN